MERVSITFSSWVRLAIVGLLVYAFFQISDLLLILLTAIVIASAVEPATRWAKRQGVPRLPTVISIYVATVLVLSIFFYFLLLPLIDQVSSFLKTLTIYSNSILSDGVLSNMFKSQGVFGGLDTPVIFNELSTHLNSFSGFISQGVFSTASAVFGGVMSMLLIIVLSFYLAVQEDGIGKFLKVIVPLRYEEYVTGLWRRSQNKIGRWMQGQLMLGIVVAVMVYVGLVIIGVPNALLLAVLAGIFELIPLFGPIISAIPAIFVAYGALGATPAIIVAGMYLLIQQLENHVIYPLVVKKVVGVPPMVSIIALIIGGKLAGFLGILIAVPMATIVIELLEDLEQRKHSA